MKDKDCEKKDQFTKPDDITQKTTCTIMSLKEKKEYCKKNNKVFFNGKCIYSSCACYLIMFLKVPKQNFTAFLHFQPCV